MESLDEVFQSIVDVLKRVRQLQVDGLCGPNAVVSWSETGGLSVTCSPTEAPSSTDPQSPSSPS